MWSLSESERRFFFSQIACSIARLLSATMVLFVSMASAGTPSRVISIEKPGILRIEQGPLEGSSIEIVQDSNHQDETWPEEWLVLIVKDSSNRAIGTRPFHSSYGKFRVDVIDLDVDGVPEFLFMLGKGRGNSAREEALCVTHFNKGHFEDVLSTPIAGFYGPGAEWRYTVEYQAGKAKEQSELVLRLRVDKANDSKFTSTLIPSEPLKVIRWEANPRPARFHRGKALVISSEARGGNQLTRPPPRQ